MTEPYYTAFGRRVRKARLARGLSQAQLGDLLDPPMTRASIANIEGALQRVLAHQVPMFARLLRVPAAQLLTGRKP